MSAFLWMKSGDRARALPLIEAALAANRTAIEAGDRSQLPLYENAALQSMLGDRAAALELLEGSCNAGNKEAEFLKVDPLFAPLAHEPRFLQLVDRINRGLREMKQRVDLSDLDELAGIGQPAAKATTPPAVPPRSARTDPGRSRAGFLRPRYDRARQKF